MAQPSTQVITADQLDKTNWKNQFLEVATSPDDFATGESTIIVSTVPFLAPGSNFTDVPLYPVGLAQNLAYSETVAGSMIPEIGSIRKTNTAGSSMGSGNITRLLIHGNSLIAALYRPTLQFIKNSQTLSPLADTTSSSSNNINWISGLISDGFSLYDAATTEEIDRVVATGGMNSVLFKIPFGLAEIKRDPRQRVIAINYFEQCSLRGNQGGTSAGQFQVVESLSFEFERMRSLMGLGPFVLDNTNSTGV